MIRKTLLTTLVLLALPFTAGSVAAEEPDNQACDGIPPHVRALCAGADAGGNAGCDNTNQAAVSCWYTYSWNINASTDIPLPGGAHLAWAYEVTWCYTGGACTPVEAGVGEQECAWMLNDLEPCAEVDAHTAGLDFVLELGQCVEVYATVQVSSAAWTLDEDNPLFHAEVASEQTGAGAACYLDDGRN